MTKNLYLNMQNHSKDTFTGLLTHLLVSKIHTLNNVFMNGGMGWQAYKPFVIHINYNILSEIERRKMFLLGIPIL
jgi:hypothetical protein